MVNDDDDDDDDDDDVSWDNLRSSLGNQQFFLLMCMIYCQENRAIRFP